MANGNNLPAIRNMITGQAMQNSIKTRLGEKAGTFTTSILDVIGDTPMLQQCDPALVVKEALKAAALDLPINKNLGFAYVIPYKDHGVMKPNFQMGYKGFIQLAIRTGQYKHMNAGIVYEGEEMIEDRIRGTLTISGKKTSDKPIGYFAFMQLINGFEKAVAWSRENVQDHAKRFSKSFGSATSPWKTDFDAMALKTMILQLVPKYGPMTIEMTTAMVSDRSDMRQFDARVDDEVAQEANNEVIDIEPGHQTSLKDRSMEGALTPGQLAEIEATEKAFDDAEDDITEDEKAEILAAEQTEAAPEGPGY